MPPLTGNPIATCNYLAIQDHAAANPGTNNHAKYQFAASRAAISCLAESETISIVSKAHLPPQAFAQIFI